LEVLGSVLRYLALGIGMQIVYFYIMRNVILTQFLPYGVHMGLVSRLVQMCLQHHVWRTLPLSTTQALKISLTGHTWALQGHPGDLKWGFKITQKVILIREGRPGGHNEVQCAYFCIPGAPKQPRLNLQGHEMKPNWVQNGPEVVRESFKMHEHHPRDPKRCKHIRNVGHSNFKVILNS